jgi:uncharacterized protein
MGDFQDPLSRHPESILKGRVLKSGNRISSLFERIRSWKSPGIGTLFLLSFLAGLIFIGLMVYLPLGGSGGDGAVPEKGHSPFSPELREGRETGPPGDLPGSAMPPRIALVIDDLGYEPARDAAWLEIPAKITLAVLPFGPSSRRVAQSAHERGFCVLLHAPMEPEGQVSDRTETFRFRRGMSGAEMKELLDRMLKDVPFVAGVSNHMGSAFTSDPEAMSLFTAILKDHGLFLLDSLTTPRSVAVASALRTGIPVVRRDLFLDVDPDPDAMRRQWEEALSIAKRKGSAVVVCHGRTESLQAVRRFLPDLAAQGIRAVTLSELLAGEG